MPVARELTDLGLPDGHSVCGLAYHAPTASILIHTQAKKPHLWLKRLFLRKKNEVRYRFVHEFPEGTLSVESFALNGMTTALYFLTYAWQDSVGNVTGNWDQLYRYDLETQICESHLRRGSVVPPNGYQDAWFTKVLTATGEGDGEILICTAGLVKSMAVIDHCIVEVHLKSLKIVPVAILEGVFA